MSDHTPASSSGSSGGISQGATAESSFTDTAPPPPPRPDQQPYAQQQYGGPSAPQGNGLAVTGLVLGIIGVLFAFIPVVGLFMGILLGVLAAIFGAVGMGRSKQPYRGGRGMAIAGLVLGIIAIAMAIFQGVVIGAAVDEIDQDLQDLDEQIQQDLEDLEG